MPHPPGGLPPDPFTTGSEGAIRTPPNDENDTACAVCAQPLLPAANGAGEAIAWLHLGELPGALESERIDHIAVPVRRSEVHVTEICDFCSAQNPTWVLPVEEFEVSPTAAATKDWAACEVCARLIRKGRWNDLTKRSVLNYASKYGISPAEPELVNTLKAFHSQVREYQTGPIRRA